MRTTLKDIAELAGVSTTTVSRILNGRESGLPIREATRQKVLAVAAELHYKPNLMARALRGGSSSLVGVIAQNITSLFHSQVIRGINQTTVSRGYRMFLGHVQRSTGIALDYGSIFEQSHVDGILILGEWEGDDEALDTLMYRHQHVVGVTDRVSPRRFPGVHTNNHIGVRLALDHLRELGHSRIACVSDPSIQDGKMRIELYQEYMRQQGFEEHIQAHVTPRTFEASCQLGRQLFAEAEQPTAVFAATDAIAIGLLQAAFQRGVAVPRQVSIVGYDDIDVAAFTIPPLTTIRQPGIEMGQAAAALLLDMIEQEIDRDEIEDIVMTPTLVVRQSTAPPRST